MRRKPRHVLWGGRRGDVWVGHAAYRRRLELKRAAARAASVSSVAPFVRVIEQQLAELARRTRLPRY